MPHEEVRPGKVWTTVLRSWAFTLEASGFQNLILEPAGGTSPGGGQRTNSLKLREQPRLAQDEVERSSMPLASPASKPQPFLRDHCWVSISPARWCLWGWGHIQRSQESRAGRWAPVVGSPPPPAGLVRG